MANRARNHLLVAADEVGCRGLVGGVAFNRYSNAPSNAWEAKKSQGPFYCRDCQSEAILHKCVEKIDHFAHHARLSPATGAGEGALHSACKVEFCKSLKEEFPAGMWDTERPIPKNAKTNIPDLRPDISGRIGDQRLVIEVQASAMTLPQIIKRIQGYTARRIPMLWVVPLFERLGKEEFRPRLFERYLHSIYHGRVYYWWPDLGSTLALVHFGPAWRDVELRTWPDEYGGENSGGGYTVQYRIIKTPVYGPFSRVSGAFSAVHREGFTPDNERKAVPPCWVWKDTHEAWWPKDENKPPPMPGISQVRAHP